MSKKYWPRRSYKKKKFTRNKASREISRILTEEIRKEIDREIIAKICESALDDSIEKDQIQKFLYTK